MHDKRFPNESSAYRAARDELLKAEAQLRAQIESVAALRRALPPGGELPEDYEFEELVDGERRVTRFSELFGRHDALFLYSFMFAEGMDAACPMCTAMIDGFNGQVEHIAQNLSVAIVAKHDIEAIASYAAARGWHKLRFLSSKQNSYNVDYFGEVDGRQVTTANVFVRADGAVRHFWNSELSYAPMIDGGHMRHLDLIWPLWNVLDMTPAGRGDFMPRLAYGDR